MKTQPARRKSHCAICGKRLSQKTGSGVITWTPSHVNDKGIYCETCHRKLQETKDLKRESK